MANFLLVPVLCVAAWAAYGVGGDTTASLPHTQDGAAKNARANTFAIDGGHSSVLFRVVHLKAGPFWGRFNKVSGSFRIDDGNLSDSFVKVEIPVDSVDSNSAGRDRHLKNTDFFNAKEYPTMSFESTKIEKKGDDVYHVHGTLEMRGQKKTVVAKVAHVGTAEMSKRFGLRSGYEADFTIDRTDFGIDYMAENGGLGKNVRIILGIEGKVAK